MSKHVIKGWIYLEKDLVMDRLGCDPKVGFMEFEPGGAYFPERVSVREHSFEVEIPDDFNPVPQMVAALEEQKRQERLKLAQKLAEIDEKISKLTCLTNEVTA